jgi:Spherulation-specific family 4
MAFSIVTMAVVKRPLLVVGVFALALFGVVAAAWSASAQSVPRMLVPAYFDPPSRQWTNALSAPAQTILIVNPNNGPGTSPAANYQRLISHARATGHEMIGYVYTRYGARPVSTVEGDMNRWSSLYGVHDIFFDEVSQSSAQLSYYRTLTAYASAHGAKLTVLNPGTVPAQAYFGLGSVVVTFEDTYAAFQHARFPAWLRNEPAGQQANIVYAVPSAADAQATLASMHSHGVGVGYVTGAGSGGSNPYDTLPPYYDSETGWLSR